MKILLSTGMLLCLLGVGMAQPGITPASLTVNAGASFAFVGKSTNAVSFQWVFQGTNIAEQTNSELYVDNPATNQSGIYWSVTSNLDGSITSNSATLTVLQGTIVNFAIAKFADGSTSNVLVELFDHDKPATTENFVHYIRSIAYSNMFFDRLIPGFVLQGGDFDATDRTNTAPDAVPDLATFANVFNIYDTIVQAFQVTDPTIPFQINSEFNVGPYVSNVKGTLALAFPANNPNGGSSAFFFNLVDNAGFPYYLDEQQFTVFGRVIGGGNVLDYFNNAANFSKLPGSQFPPGDIFTNNPFTNGIFDLIYETNSATNYFTDVPVNYYGTNVPANSNLFFVDFSFPNPNAQPFTDTIPPTARITYPTANTLMTNGFDFTVQGTAQDNVGVAFVECTLYPLNGPYSGLPLGAPALGTTNWSLDVFQAFDGLEPGIYNVAATPQDGAGNVGTIVYQDNLIVTAVLTNGVGTVQISPYPATGPVVSNAIGAFMQSGSPYLLQATAGTNQIFVNWADNVGDPPSFSPVINFQMQEAEVLTANFLSNAIPGSIAFTYPPLQGTALGTNGVFTISGTITGLTNTPVNVTCQLYSSLDEAAAIPLMQTQGTTNWNFPVTNLADGEYIAQTIATDSAGRQTLITNTFTLKTADQLSVVVNGPGAVVTNLNGQYLVQGQAYSMKATAPANAIFEDWSGNGATSINPVENFTMSLNLSLTADFISNGIPGGISFTYPVPGKPAYATNGTLTIQGAINGPASPPVAVTCRLFSYQNGQLTGAPLQTTGTNSWSVQTALPNGEYYVQAIAQDAQGRQTLITNSFSVQTVNQLTVNLNGPGTIVTNLNGQYLVPGLSYTMKAKAAPGASFATWSDGANSTLNPVETFTMSPNLTLTATFVSNNAAGTISFTYPPPNALLTNPTVNLAGATKSSLTATQIVCQLFFNSNSIAPASVASNYTATWLAPQTNLLPGQATLAPGAYTAVATAYAANGETSLIRENFKVLAHLAVATSTNVVVPVVLGTNGVNTNIVRVASPAQLGTVSLKSTYLNLGESKTITAVPKPGYVFAYWDINGVTVYPTQADPDPTSESTLPFSVFTNASITANFATNYYPRISGTYNGIFYPPNVAATPTNSGTFTMTISSAGLTTVNLAFPGRAVSFSGTIPYYAGVGVEAPGGPDGNSFILTFTMDLTNFSGAFSGLVYDADNVWFANLTVYKAATELTAESAVVPGRYVLTIPGDHTGTNGLPGGDSYAVYSISSLGKVTAASLGGWLADNTSFSLSTGVSTNGIWPFYLPLSFTDKHRVVHKGIILGWQTNSSPTNFSGQIEWYKPAYSPGVATAYYTNGFDFGDSTTPAKYTAPAAGTHYQIVFSGATLAAPLTNFLTVSSAQSFTANSGQPGLTVNLTPSTGAITGQFIDPAGNSAKKINGAFTSPVLGGSGYFLDTNAETGYFQISLIPPP